MFYIVPTYCAFFFAKNCQKSFSQHDDEKMKKWWSKCSRPHDWNLEWLSERRTRMGKGRTFPLFFPRLFDRRLVGFCFIVLESRRRDLCFHQLPLCERHSTNTQPSFNDQYLVKSEGPVDPNGWTVDRPQQSTFKAESHHLSIEEGKKNQNHTVVTSRFYLLEGFRL